MPPAPPAPLPRTFWVLFAGMLVNRIGGFVVPFLTLYLVRERGFTTEGAGTLVALYGVGSLASTLGAGWLTDHAGRRPTMLWGLVLSGSAMAALGLAKEHALVAALILLLGMVGESYRPAMSATVTDLVPEEGRTRAFGWLYWAANLGFAIAPLLAGFFAERSWLALFLGDAATTLLCAAAIGRYVPETRPAAAAQARRGGSLLVPLRDPVFLAFVVLNFLTAALFMQCASGIPLAMAADGLPTSDVGPALAVNGGLIVLLQPLLTPRLARFPRARVLSGGALLIALGFGLYAFADTFPLYVLGTAVWTLGEILLLPTAQALVADLSPEALRGQYQGVYQVGWSFAAIVAPATSGIVIGRWGAEALWAGCALAGLLAAAGHAVLWSRERAPRAAAGA